MKARFGVLTVALILITSCGNHPIDQSKTKERWDLANNPIRILPSDYLHKFSDLPLEGSARTQPWADSYWPSAKGGIAYRWVDGVKGHEVEAITIESATKMSIDHLASLSPAEKFDIFVGDANMSLFKNELGRTHPTDGAWFGICHGWAPAALSWAEPKAVLVKGPSGIPVPFGATDIKALLSLHSAEYSSVKSKSLASRCNSDLSKNPDAAARPECRDTNAGAFHLVLANLLGIKKRGFVADVTRDLEVWNQPVSGFKSKIVSESVGRSPGAAFFTAREVVIETEMFYGLEVHPEWSAVGSNITSKVYTYRLELNLFGQVIGGEWLSEDRPDFIWQNSAPELVDAKPNRASSGTSAIAWSHLKTIYDASMAAPTELENPINDTAKDDL